MTTLYIYIFRSLNIFTELRKETAQSVQNISNHPHKRTQLINIDLNPSTEPLKGIDKRCFFWKFQQNSVFLNLLKTCFWKLAKVLLPEIYQYWRIIVCLLFFFIFCKLDTREIAWLKINFWIYHITQFSKIYWITKWTTTGYFFPFFSSLLKKRGKKKRRIK